MEDIAVGNRPPLGHQEISSYGLPWALVHGLRLCHFHVAVTVVDS